jgi:hypothetical protein
MAFKLEKEKTDTTPYVLIDENRSYMKFEGESYHENVPEFFKEIFNWLNIYLKTDFDSFTFDCEFRYFNSATVKLLMNILLNMDNAKNSKNITVNWITTKNNKIIIECGEDFKEDLENLNFNLVIR